MDVVFCGDEKCIICSSNIYEENHICKNCRNKIMECRDYKLLEHGGICVKCYSASYYSKVVRELIIRLKYKQDFSSGELLGEIMLNTIKANDLEADYITFVPSSKSTLRKRGYNQSMLLARFVARQSGIRLIDVLDKSSYSKDQIGLGRKERMENMKGTFKYSGHSDIENKRILLIDDVITTGATALWCCDALLKNGAKEVTVLTAAKSKV